MDNSRGDVLSATYYGTSASDSNVRCWVDGDGFILTYKTYIDALIELNGIPNTLGLMRARIEQTIYSVVDELSAL